MMERFGGTESIKYNQNSLAQNIMLLYDAGKPIRIHSSLLEYSDVLGYGSLYATLFLNESLVL